MTYQLNGCRELGKITEKQKINSFLISKIETSFYGLGSFVTTALSSDFFSSGTVVNSFI